jgi:hypothetical protein
MCRRWHRRRFIPHDRPRHLAETKTPNMDRSQWPILRLYSKSVDNNVCRNGPLAGRHGDVTWDPNSPAGAKIGWRIHVADDKQADWKEGRVLRYEPCTHKHKIQLSVKSRLTDKVQIPKIARGCIYE